ncbi:MAG: hypothetical protein DMF09_14245 [Verrucomicrobia bacterium]|nr:MAG: hypothetical protein DMF09_14245 [Verrucomicrobiota bacterium]
MRAEKFCCGGLIYPICNLSTPCEFASDWVARASRVLASASSRSRTFLASSKHLLPARLKGSLFRRDAETNTRDACATPETTAATVRNVSQMNTDEAKIKKA